MASNGNSAKRAVLEAGILARILRKIEGKTDSENFQRIENEKIIATELRTRKILNSKNMDRLSNDRFAQFSGSDGFLNRLKPPKIMHAMIWLFLFLSILPAFSQTEGNLEAVKTKPDVIPVIDFNALRSGTNSRMLRTISPLNARVQNESDFCSSGVPPLRFRNPSRISGSSSTVVGAIHRFSNVVELPGGIILDAIVTTNQIQRARLIEFDGTGSGYNDAFQPVLAGANNGQNNTNQEGFAEFLVEFVLQGTTTPYAVPNFSAYLIDIDGDGNFYEFQAVGVGTNQGSLGNFVFGNGADNNITEETYPSPFGRRFRDTTGSSAENNGNPIPTDVFNRIVKVDFVNTQSFLWRVGLRYRQRNPTNSRYFSFYVSCIDDFQVGAADYSDAPSSYGTPSHTTPSNLSPSNITPRFGAIVDRENGPFPGPNADGDDLNSDDPGSTANDEDGVTFSGSFDANQNKTITVNTRGTGQINAWIDWNRDGDFNDAGEQIVTNQAVSGTSTNTQLIIPVPCDAVPGDSYMRFRINTAGGLGPDGGALNGEVEDYKIAITNNTVPVTITDQPDSAEYCLNEQAQSLSVLASGGSGNYTYQWFSNSQNNNTTGTEIQNANSATYTPPTTQVGEVWYYVVVTSDCKPVASNPAKVTVNALPIIDPIQGLDVCVDGTSQMSSTTPNGTWGTTTPELISISADGLVTGLAVGQANVTYTVTQNNCTSTVNKTINVNALAEAPEGLTFSVARNTGNYEFKANKKNSSNTLRWYDSPAGGTPINGTPSINSANLGTFKKYVSEVNESGCESPIVEAAIIVSEGPDFPPCEPEDFNCTTNNLNFPAVYLSDSEGNRITGTCEDGTQQDVFITVEIQQNSNTARYETRLFAKLFIGESTTPIQINSYIGLVDEGAQGIVKRVIQRVDGWQCGDELRMTNILLVWLTNANSIPDDCGDYNKAQSECLDEIFVSAPLSADIEYTSCYGDDGYTFFFNADANGGFIAEGNSYIYKWDFDNDGTIDLDGSIPGSNNQTPTFTYPNKNATKVRLVVEDDNGLTVERIEDLIYPTEFNASATVTPPTCSVDTGTITVDQVTGATYAITGSSFQSSNVFTNVSPGTYTVSVKTLDFCIRTTTVEVPDQPATPDAPSSGGDQSVCVGDVIQALIPQATAPQGFIVRWYEAASGGSPIANPSWNQLGTKIFYAESFNAETGCFSATRTPVSLTNNECSISLLKTGELIDLEIGECPEAGAQVEYTFVVTNLSDVTITNVSISDGPFGFTGTGAFPAINFVSSSNNSPEGTLLSNESATYTATYTLLQEDINKADFIENQATVTAIALGSTVSAVSGDAYLPDSFETNEETTIVEYCRNAAIRVVKTSDQVPGEGEDCVELAVNDVVTYTFTVTNAGNVPLSNVDVNDPLVGLSAITLVSGDAGNDGILGLTETWIYTATYSVKQSDIEAGKIENQATAEGFFGQSRVTDLSGTTVDTDDKTIIDICQDPSLSINKTVTTNDDVLGGELTFDITVQNTGNVTLFNIYVEDIQTGDNWIINELAPNAIDTRSVTVEITQDLIDARCYENTAIAEIREFVESQEVPNQGQDTREFVVVLSAEPSTVTECFTQTPDIELLKDGVFNDENGDGFGNVGETITYTFTVTNTGNVTLSDITIEDDKVTVIGGPIASLAPGVSDDDTFTATYVLTQEDIDAGFVVNTALARGEAPGGDPEDPSDDITDESSDPTPVEEPSTECTTCTETEIPQNPEIELLKDGIFNDENGDGFGDVGETITYTFTVTNIGNVTLSDITIEDDKVTVIGGPIASLAPGVSDDDTFTATYVLTQEDIDAGFVVNTALARGEAPGGDPEDPSDDITDESSDPTPVEEPSTECTTCTETEIPQNPAIELLKDGIFNDEDGDGFGNVGETITYTFTVTNTGNVTLSDITVTDQLVDVNGGPISLAPGLSNSTEFTATYVLTQADIDAGFVVNTALAEGTAPNGDVVEDESSDPTPVEEPSTDCETCTETEIPQNPDLEIVKTDNGAEVDAAGDVITYTLTATNTGNVTLTNVTIEDPLTRLDENVGTLIPGQSVQRTTSYTVTQADVDVGFVLNTALTTGESPDGEDPSDEDEIETPVQRNPSLTIVKTDNGAEVDAAGDVITYTLTATNTGNVTLTNVIITDPLTGLDENVGTLIPGQSVQRTTSYTVTQADVDAGFVLNTALTTGESPDGEDPSDEDEIETPVQRNPSLTIVKTDNGAEVDAAGDVITYTLTATNTGNVTLTNVIITDPLTRLDENVGTLIPGQSVQRTTSYTVTQADVDAGFVLNTALTTGESPDGEDPSDEDEIETPVQRNPSLTIVKTDNGAEVDAAGDVITYTLTATNTGNVTLTNVIITDPLTGLDENVGTLIPGQSVQRTTSYTVTQADVNAGFVLNTALTTGESPDGEDPSDEDEIETPISRTSDILITKVADVEGVQDEGEVINYTITVTNTGNTTLTNVSVEDPKTGLSEVIEVLEPGQAVSFETSYTVTIDDVAAQEAILNVATATYTDPVTEQERSEEAEELVEILCIDRTLITGTIFNDMTGEPLAGVPVTLIPQGSTPGTTKIVVTGADGRYSFKDFPAGSYLLQVQDANLNAARGLYPVESSLFFTDIDVCIYQTKDFGYETYDGPVLGDFVWYDLNGDGIQNEWFDANNDGQVTQNPIQGQAIDISEWEWFDLNGDGRYDGPENEGELNKAGFGNAQSANITVTGPNGYEEDVIVGIIGYWRTRPETGLGDYTATLTIDEFLDAEAQRMRGTGLIKVLPDAGARMMGINSTRTEVRCGVTTGNEIMRTVTSDQQVFLDMDFGIRCLDAEVEIIANDDDFGDHFISFGGVIGNILDNDLLEGQRPDPDDVDFEFTELDGIIGLLIDENGELSLIPGVNEVRSYTLGYTLRETLFPDNNDDALVFFRILNDNVDLSVTKTSFEAEIYEGDEFEYEIVVSNIGGTPATNVTIVDNLPASVTYLSSRVENVSSQQIQVGAPTISGSTITWNVPFLPADGVITLRVRVKAGDAGSIQNVVVVDSEEEDTNVDNNTDTDVNQVLPFRIPNVITPNNDGDNDNFEIKGLGKFVASEIVIFNRYGDHVLEKENYQNDWNAPGQVAGTYFYVLKLTDRNGRVHEFKGWIQVIKE